jgi:hypothetical protein
MADNVPITAGTGTDIATDDVAAVHYQRMKLVDGTLGGTDAIAGDATNGLDVDVTRLPSIPAGTNNIGDVDVLTLPELPAGTNNIGDVDVLTLPALPAGNNNIGDVDIASGPTGSSALQNQGAAAADAAVVGNPLAVGGRASDAVPTAVGADGRSAWLWLSREGAQIVAPAPHLALDGAPYSLIGKTVQQTTTQTGSVVWTPTGGKKLVITSFQIQVGGTTAGTVQLWFEASNGDTTYTRGTDPAIFDGEFAPSSTNKPGVMQTGLWIAPGADFDLRLTTSAAINPITITVWGYEI